MLLRARKVAPSRRIAPITRAGMLLSKVQTVKKRASLMPLGATSFR